MNADDTSGARISRSLATRGFTYSGRSLDRWYTFEGALHVDGVDYPVRLDVDPTGQALPRISLIPIPDSLKPVAPRVSASGNLCYAASNSITLDVFDQGGQVLACVERAQLVLGQILRGELTADLEEEFFACWPAEGFCLLDFDEGSNRPVRAVVLKSADGARPMTAVTDNVPATIVKLKACGLTVDENRSVSVRRVVTAAAPRAMQDQWPPRTVADLLRWQAALDRRTRKKLETIIHAEAKTGANGVLCVVESPKFKYAFAVAFDRKANKQTHSRSPLQLAYQSALLSMVCFRMDDAYLAQRNTPGRRTLAGKRIALIGCGTIGGYLAESLVKAGAGTGGGELALVDFDILLPQNIGRHRLGMNHLFHSKSAALAEELARSAPSATFRPLPADAMNVDLSAVDFVIDATGEEALGHLLAQRLSCEAFRPSLSVWIEGPGTAVRALLRDSPGAACVRCLKTVDRTPIYRVVDGELPSMFAGHGCESLYVPFPATASMQAACLGAEMVVDWINGDVTPRLRTRVLDTGLRPGSDDVDAQRQASCPACST
jgi:molybdopterin/thiamine biosynthesis adenylyltransferase